MRKIRVLSLILCIICFAIVIFNIWLNAEKSEKNEDELIEINAINVKIGANTKVEKYVLYEKCGHKMLEDVSVSEMINLTKEEIEKIYPEYEVIEFSNDLVVMIKRISKYCNEHYLVKENNNKLCIYVMNDEGTYVLYDSVDVNIDTFRQNDRYMFKGIGVNIYGKNNLIRFIEDFDS